MEDKVNLSMSEVLEALRGAVRRVEVDDAAFTTEELADALGVHVRTVQYAIKALHKAGKLECVRKVKSTITGAQRPVPAYRIKA